MVGEENFWQELVDLSGFNNYPVNIFGVEENYLKSSYDEYYIPSEVNGQDASSLIGVPKINAYEALYDYNKVSSK